jgi:hypothetical protein
LNRWPGNTVDTFSFEVGIGARADPVTGIIGPTELLVEGEIKITRFTNGLLTRGQAVASVNALEALDVSTINASDKCPHCWATWDEETDNYNNSPVCLPCADGQHVLGFDCLVEILTAVGPLYPLCRINIVQFQSIR